MQLFIVENAQTKRSQFLNIAVRCFPNGILIDFTVVVRETFLIPLIAFHGIPALFSLNSSDRFEDNSPICKRHIATAFL